MQITRNGSAAWRGGYADGTGALSTESGALKEQPYGFVSRFQRQRGTNPEELIAAAHAGCFAMTLAKILGEAGLTAERLDTSAEVTLKQVNGNGGCAITAVHLTLRAKVAGIDAAAFAKFADRAKAGCAVSKALKASVTLDVALLP
jgi:osmotically inducible protein OsmC